jgi:hypothetical protein
MIRIAAVLAASTLACTLAGAAAAEQPHPFKGERVATVMTRNLYVGFDVSGALTAPDLIVFATQAWLAVQMTDPPARAAAWAEEIAAARPDLVGLQEAALFRTDFPADGPATPAETVVYDFVGLLVAELRARGLEYAPVARFEGMDIEAPTLLGIDVRVTNYDVVLARADLKVADLKLSNPQSAGYATALGPPLIPFALPRGWASVDAKIRGKEFRFVTTHLEAFAEPFRMAQAAELLATVGATELPLVVVGDVNSPPGGPTYELLRASGLQDVWSQLHPADPGLTCCREPTLTADDPHHERIDVVLHRGGLTGLSAELVDTRTASGLLWASDHAGVLAGLRVPR